MDTGPVGGDAVDVTIIIDSFWSLFWAVVFILIVGIVSGRILGVQRGWGRATVAGILGSVVGLLLSVVIQMDEKSITTADLLIPGFGFALLVTMVLSIVLDVLLRPRRRGPRPRLRTRVRTFFTVGGRLADVARIARRNGVATRVTNRSALANPENALRVKLFLQECGGMFVKFGQIASTRSDVLPAQLVESLSELQSNVAPVPWEAVRRILDDQLDGPVEATFASFSQTPLAAASIGQTHVAELLDGRQVVVKVRRPDVEVGVARDSAVLRWGTRVLLRRSEAARSIGLKAISEELIRSVREELSYVHEAGNARTLAAATPAGRVKVPAIHTEFSTDALLVMQKVAGRPLSDAGAVDACGVPRAELAADLLGVFLDQLMNAGVFHADPHPGNVLIDAEGSLWLIDFGAVGLVDPVSMDALRLMGAGLMTREPAMLARALRVMAGSAADGLDPQALEAEISVVLSERLRAGGFDPKGLQEIIDVMRRHALPVPPTFTVLARALLTLEGTLRTLEPGLDTAAAASRQLGSAMRAQGDVRSMARQEFVRALPSLRALPALVEDIGLQARSGRLRLELDPVAGRTQGQVTRWLDQALFTVIAGLGLIASAVLLVGAAIAADPSQDNVGLDALRVVGWLGLVFSGVMLMRVVAQILRRDGELDGLGGLGTTSTRRAGG